MGRIIETIKINNFIDEHLSERGLLTPDNIRNIEVEALADSGATTLCLQRHCINQLGLPFLKEVNVRTGNGSVRRRVYSGAHLFLLGRDDIFSVMEVPDDCLNLIGQIPLEELDFVLDLPGRRIIPNPEHGGELTMEIYVVF